MQILPTTSQSTLSLTESFFIGAGFQDASSDSFAEELFRQQEARNAVANGESHSVEVALQDSATVTPLEQAPYNLTSDNGVTYSAEEVLFTQEELRELERDLRREGAPEETLTELKKLAEQPGGSSLGEVMAALQSPRTYPTLSEEERETLKGLTAKLDPSGDLYSDIRGHLNGKNGKAVLDALVKEMDSLQGQSVLITKDEMGVLAKAMGLSDTSTQQLLGHFGTGSSLKLNKTQLSTFLAPAINDFALEASNKEKLNVAIDATMGPLLQEAKERMAAEKSASELSSRKTEQSKVVIEKTVLENVNSTLEGARASQVDKNLENATESQKDALDRQLLGDKELAKDMQQEGFGDGKGDAKSDTRNDTWGQLLDKTSLRTDASASLVASKNITTPVVGIGGLATNSAQQLAQSQAQAQRAQMASQAATQVERAMLTAARDGSKSIELQLHPAELGSLTITLTARNGEVSAMIRSEKSETAEILHRQMEQIRAQLEDQGVKVDKIEVRQGSQENSASHDTWSGMKEHNARQEENAQREMLERLRNLGKVRNDSTNPNDSTLERNMHSRSSSAGNATQSLYIVA